MLRPGGQIPLPLPSWHHRWDRGLGWGRKSTSGGRGTEGFGMVPLAGHCGGYLSCSPAPGVNCEVNIDDCASNPCTFGICRDGINRYDCVCQPGFTGGQAAAMERGSLEGEGGIVHLSWPGFVPLFALAFHALPCSCALFHWLEVVPILAQVYPRTDEDVSIRLGCF